MGVEDVEKEGGRVVVLDGTTVRSFANDEEAFSKAVDPQFRALDTNGDGVLSRSELRPAFERLNLIDLHFGVPVKKTPHELNALYDSVFESFDTDQNDTVDLKEFRSSLRQILLAIAEGLGSCPLTMLLEEGSLLKDAVDHETHSAKVTSVEHKDVPASAVLEIAWVCLLSERIVLTKWTSLKKREICIGEILVEALIRSSPDIMLISTMLSAKLQTLENLGNCDDFR